MVTERYQHVVHHRPIEDLVAWAAAEDLPLVGVDNLPGSVPLETTAPPPPACCCSARRARACPTRPAATPGAAVCSIAMFGSTRSINAGVASGIAMHAWVRQHALPEQALVSRMILDRFRLDGPRRRRDRGWAGHRCRHRRGAGRGGGRRGVSSRRSQLADVAKRIELRAAGPWRWRRTCPTWTPRPAWPAPPPTFGRLDIVVNNVGGPCPGRSSTPPTAFLEAFHFNVSTAHALTRAALPLLLAAGGSVVNISSVMGRVSGQGYLAYGTAKAALSHYTRLAARDLAPGAGQRHRGGLGRHLGASTSC